MFALKWCEFCGSVEKVLAKYGIDYQSIDLDSVEYQKDDRGKDLRLALRNKTTWNTFPQIFINGEFVGGGINLFDGIKNGSIQKLLDQNGIQKNDSTVDPYTQLPTWLHPRGKG